MTVGKTILGKEIRFHAHKFSKKLRLCGFARI